MTPEVQDAVEEIRQLFPNHRVEVEPEDQGGAFVMVHDLSIGPAYSPAQTWIGFEVPFLYPRADVYPHFMDGEVRRVDAQPLGESFSGPTPWRNRATIQISRRSNRWEASRDTAALKLVKILEWIRSR